MAVLGSVGSGLNVDAIVSALVNAELAPRQSSLDRRETAFNAELSAIGTLQSALSDIQTNLESLDVVTDFNQLSIDSPAAVTVEKTVPRLPVDTQSMFQSWPAPRCWRAARSLTVPLRWVLEP